MVAKANAYFFILLAIFSSSAFGQSLAGKLISAEIEITKKRMDLLDKSKNTAAKATTYDPENIFSAQKSAVHQVLDTAQQDFAFHRNYLNQLTQLNSQLTKGETGQNQAISALAEAKRPCSLENCFEILGIMNQDLMHSLADLNAQIIVNDWDKFSWAHSWA